MHVLHAFSNLGPVCLEVVFLCISSWYFMSLVVGTCAISCLESLISVVIYYRTIQGKAVVLDLPGSFDRC